MILIFSSGEGEYTTTQVQSWLTQKKAKWVRKNGSEFEVEDDFSIVLDNKNKHIYDKKQELLNAENIKAVWYRRWTGLNFMSEFYNLTNNQVLNTTIKNLLIKELRSLRYFITNTFENKSSLSNNNTAAVNKLTVLKKAQEAGLCIPPTLVTNNKKELRKFHNKYTNIITKSIQDLLGFSINKTPYAFYTSAFNKDDIDQLPNHFFPSLFQQKVDKDYEVRTFYLDGECHSMAIFSQRDKQTEVDFRKYNLQKPNRNVPVILPQIIEKCIVKLMNSLNLKTGSIDIIKDKDGNYVFLEVNPIGQFGMVSHPCNYYLEEKVANYLITIDNA